MIPEIGCFALVLALCLALCQAFFPLLGFALHKPQWIQVAKPAVLGQFIFILLAYACLTFAFISNDFSVAYVAANSNTHLPLVYRVAAVWGAHEGSLLLWITLLACWMLAVAHFSQQLPEEFRARVLAILGLISAGFLIFILTTSNPFKRYLPDFPLEGADLNPLLQDPGLVIHPPMLYMGYVGFSVAFAFAIAALLMGRLDAAWARWTRPWTLSAWCFLTLGITLGSGWAYRELGWGGWWFWDPVENASFLPWLLGTALIHSLIVIEKRGGFKSWTALLAICAFSLSLLGTFLVRSGVLVSVHAFANDPQRGRFLLQFLALVIGSALLLYAVRAPKIRSANYFALLSRDTLLLANNVLLVIAMTTVLLGTLYPLILDAFNLGKISVGPPYFNTVFIPLMIPLLLLMGIGPLCYWSKMSFAQLWQRLRMPLFLAVIIITSILFIVANNITTLVMVGISLAIWIVVTSIQSVRLQWHRQHKFSIKQLAMVVAHIGVAVCVIGITLSSHYKIERDLRMQVGDKVSVGQYDFQFMGVHDINGPNYNGVSAQFLISNNNHLVNILNAERRVYTAQQIAMTEAAIDVGLFRDLYIALGDPLPNDAWSVRIYDKPFVRWIWAGGLLMLLGGLCAIWGILETSSRKMSVKNSVVNANPNPMLMSTLEEGR